MNRDDTQGRFIVSFTQPLLEFLAALIARIFGQGAQQQIFENTSWADLGASLCIVGFVFLLNGLMAAWIRTRRRRAGQAETSDAWRSHSFLAVGKPLYLTLWICGLYFAFAPLLSKAGGEDPAFYQFAHQMFNIGFFVVLVWLFFRLTKVLDLRLRAAARKSQSKIDDVFAPLVAKTLRVIVPLVAVILALPLLDLPSAFDSMVSKITSLAVIAMVAWIAFQGVALIESVILAKYDINLTDNLDARKISTQVKILGKTLYVIIVVFTIGSMLMVFEEVRRFGTNILASAGVVGVVVGFAAQRTIANLFAGFQIAMTQPIRLDDVVVVEGEWGRIEEITLTYVVVKIWDQRRLVLPISYFIEKPFQNWTRVSAEILGSVFVYADYTVPLDDIRTEVKRIVETNADWDKKFWNVQVTDSTDRSMQIRVLVTSSDSGKAWNLRCEIREQLITYLQKMHPGSLPRIRATLEGSNQRLADPPPVG